LFFGNPNGNVREFLIVGIFNVSKVFKIMRLDVITQRGKLG
jgi:hypothetical protein